MLHAIETDIAVCPFDSVGIAAKVHGLESAYCLRPHPTGEGLRFAPLGVILPAE
jgi:hypothetical protein